MPKQPKKSKLPLRTKHSNITITQARQALPGYILLGLSNKEIKFVAIYLINGFNATQAYLDAKYPTKSRKTAGTESCHLIKEPKIKKAIRHHMEAFLAAAAVALDKRVVDQLMVEAFYDPFDFINVDGTPAFNKKEDLTPAQRRCIIGIEEKYNMYTKKYTKVIKLVDRTKARAELSRYVELLSGAGKLPEDVKEEAGKVGKKLQLEKQTDAELLSLIGEGPEGEE